MTSTSSSWTAKAWTCAAVAGAATYAVSLIVVHPLINSEQTNAWVAGQLFAPALFGFVAGGFLGSVAAERWRLTAAWLMPPVVAAIIIAFQHGASIVGQSDERRAAEEEYARSHLVSRDSVAGWRRVENPAAERQAEIAAAQLEDRQPGSSLVYGGYVNGTRAMSFTGTNTGADSEMRDELEVSPKHALINYMAGAGISEPIPVNTSIEGIEMMCADRPESTVICSWADLTTLGTAVWKFSGVHLNQALELTDLFLEELRVVDQPSR